MMDEADSMNINDSHWCEQCDEYNHNPITCEAVAALSDAAQAVVDWADEMVCKYCGERGGSLFSAHAEYCIVGKLRSLLS